jgi:hypothetical protein
MAIDDKIFITIMDYMPCVDIRIDVETMCDCGTNAIRARVFAQIGN